jgi:S-DNA-T family DNA segregation ATPase FtsK/SpoIIIE
VAAKEKIEKEGKHQFRTDLNGLAFILLAVVLLLALISYDRNDVSANTTSPNNLTHNYVGRVGAWVVWGLFLSFGAGAWIFPVLLAGFGLANFMPTLAYLRRWRSLAAVVGLMVACVGILALCDSWLPAFGTRKESVGCGGVVGRELNSHVIEYAFGRVGAWLVYGLIWLASLLFLTDFELWRWIRLLFKREPRNEEEKLAAEQAALEKRAKALEKKAKQAEPKPAATPAAKVSSKGTPSATPATTSAAVDDPNKLGADMKPIPEPTVRDMSVPQVKAAPQIMKTGDVIKADEIVAQLEPPSKGKGKTTTDAVLGRPPSTLPKIQEAAPAPLPVPEDDLDEPYREEDPDPLTVLSSHSELDDTDVPLDEESALPAQVPPTAPLKPRAPMQGQQKKKPLTVASTPMIGNYQLPELILLNEPDLTIKPTETKEELMANARLMVQTLAQFGIEVSPGDITKGPTITRYELHPAPGVKLERIAALTNNMAAALKAERLNILAPVPGKSSVGVEVPNAIKTKVIMRDLLETDDWRNTKARIPLALGKDVYGQAMIADLAEMPHLLIAGSTGSGKSVCINTIIASLLYKFTPDQLRFVMIDPKVVELQQYNALPHLVVPVVTDPKKVILALRWVVNEMEKRYQIFARVGVRNIKAFNERPKDKPLPAREPELPLLQQKDKIEPGADGFAVEVDEQIVVPRDEDIVIPEKLSYIVVIIDELADLMLVAPADVEMAIARITQMARAAGIHCIVATQRPSVDVITGVIKANIPARIAFQVASKVDSRTILDQMGADKLLGKGDMFYLPPGSAKLIRAQGALITDQEIERVVDHIAKQGKPSYEVEIHQALQKAPSSVGNMSLDPSDGTSDEDEELLEKCVDIIRSEKKASVSLLQRRLKLGYGRASRLMDTLEDRGIVGPSKGAEPRDILLDLDGQGYDGGGQSMV